MLTGAGGCRPCIEEQIAYVVRCIEYLHTQYTPSEGKGASPSMQLILIGHSMGGLVARLALRALRDTLHAVSNVCLHTPRVGQPPSHVGAERRGG